MNTAMLIKKGGGAALNYEVVGGLERPTPKAPVTLWIKTAVPVSGHIFSADRPGNTAEGTVWIETGNSSAAAFNALQSNAIFVYPLSAAQLISGSYAERDAEVCIEGVWQALSLFPLSLVPISAESAGEWELLAIGGNYGTFITAEGWINLNSNNTTSAKAVYGPINLTAAEKLVYTYTQTYSCTPVISIIEAETGTVAVKYTPTEYGYATSLFTVNIDIAALSGSYMIQFTTSRNWGDDLCLVKSMDIS